MAFVETHWPLTDPETYDVGVAGLAPPTTPRAFWQQVKLPTPQVCWLNDREIVAVAHDADLRVYDADADELSVL